MLLLGPHSSFQEDESTKTTWEMSGRESWVPGQHLAEPNSGLLGFLSLQDLTHATSYEKSSRTPGSFLIR